MDIIAAFEAVVGGSNPSESTKKRNLTETPSEFIKMLYTVSVDVSGYCLMVGRVLAKDEVGVRFSLSAQ